LSPTILRVRGYRFYFFSREESRLHVHVQHADGEAKFWIDPVVELESNYGLKPKQVAEALKLVEGISMTSGTLGRSTSPTEVTNVSGHGFWLFVGEREMFVSFEHFPWFRDASIRAITNVKLPSPHHLYWPDLDVDLAVESIEHPEKYPLVSQARSNKMLRPKRLASGKSKSTRARLRLRS
jgi:hypothetical protein